MRPSESSAERHVEVIPGCKVALQHILYDVWVADGDILARVESLRQIMLSAAAAGGATVLASRFEQFQPSGVTGFLLLAESHLSVHTWTEARFAAFDVLTCGTLRSEAIIEFLRQQLAPVRERVREISRGA